MRQKFFTKTIQSDFIKSLLYNTPLPTYNTIQVGEYIIKGHTYVYDRSIIKCTQSGYLCRDISILEQWRSSATVLGEFILGKDILGIRDSVPIVTSGSYIYNGYHYILGSYNLRYNLNDDDPDYPIFDSTQSYNSGDIVQYSINNLYHLYQATMNIPANTPWNSNQWNFITAYERPYTLIQCTEDGKIDDIPLGASYKVLQTFEPETLLETSRQLLDKHTYYIRIALVNGQTMLQLIYNENLEQLNQKAAKWITYSNYIPEMYYTKFANRFISTTDYYDSETHKRLGQLLRFYRDVYHLDLMAYYNCWNGEYLNNYQIYNDQLTKMEYTSFKVIKVPIKFNKEYTIAIESDATVKLVPTIMKLNEFIQTNVGQSNVIKLDNLLDDNTVKQYSSLSFNQPITFKLTNNSDVLLSSVEPSVGNSTLLKSEFLQRYEKDLYLIIQLPKNNQSSIVVLEGNYLNTDTNKIFNLDNLQQIGHQELNELLLSNLSLLQLNDGVTYPFADRLIEYLLYNVITGMDEIGEDITRVRKKLGNYLHYDPTEVAWSDYLRILIFDMYMNNSKSANLDISGYVDKETEQYINTL